MVKTGVERVIVRFDIPTSRIDTVLYSDASHEGDYNLLVISNTEIFFSYRSSSELHHAIKASYIEESGPSYFLNEDYHQTISGYYARNSISSLGTDGESIWHAINIDYYALYFQYNLTDFSLIGNKHVSSQAGVNGRGMDIDVSDGIV